MVWRAGCEGGSYVLMFQMASSINWEIFFIIKLLINCGYVVELKTLYSFIVWSFFF